MPAPAIPITGDTDADLLLQREPLAPPIGMPPDQQAVPYTHPTLPTKREGYKSVVPQTLTLQTECSIRM